MADSDSEIEFNMEPNKRDMGDDQPDSDTEEHDQEHEDARLDGAASVLSSLEGMPALEEIPIQHQPSKRALEGEYLGIPIDQNARGDISTNARAPTTLHTFPPMKPQTFNSNEDWESSYYRHFEVCAELARWSHQDKALYLAACLRGNGICKKLGGTAASTLRTLQDWERGWTLGDATPTRGESPVSSH